MEGQAEEAEEEGNDDDEEEGFILGCQRNALFKKE